MRRRASNVMGVAGGVAAIGLAVAATIAGAEPSAKLATFSLWGGSLGLLALAVPGARRPGPEGPRWHFWAMAALIALALLPRGIALGQYPVDIHGDEGEVFFEALSVWNNPQRSLFSYGWFQLPALEFWLQGICMKLVGEDLVGLRAGATVLGTLSLAGQAVFLREFFGSRVALIGLLPLTCYHWHLQLSRTSMTFIESTLAACFTFGLFAMGWCRQSPRAFTLCGVAMGLGCLTYPGSRIVPAILAVLALSEFVLRPRQWPRQLRAYVFVLLGFTISLLPGLPSLVSGWDHYNARSRGVVIWSPGSRAHASSVYQTDSLVTVAAQQSKKVFSIFLWGRDASLQYGFRGHWIDPLLVGFALLGMWICVIRFRDVGHRLLLLWFVLCAFVGGALTVDAPQMQRLSALATVPHSLAAVALCTVVSYFTANRSGRWRTAAWALAVLLCLGSASWSLHAYFRVLPTQMPPSVPTRLARHFQQLPSDVKVRMLMAPAMYWTHGTIRMLNLGRDGRDLSPSDLSRERTGPGPLLFAAYRGNVGVLDELRKHFPDGTEQTAPSLPEVVFYFVPERAR
jgi:hypothetical protein